MKIKPRISRYLKGWLCCGMYEKASQCGYGATPADAYATWKAKR